MSLKSHIKNICKVICSSFSKKPIKTTHTELRFCLKLSLKNAQIAQVLLEIGSKTLTRAEPMTCVVSSPRMLLCVDLACSSRFVSSTISAKGGSCTSPSSTHYQETLKFLKNTNSYNLCYIQLMTIKKGSRNFSRRLVTGQSTNCSNCFLW